ncbi:Ribosomal l34e domain-containing protein [Mycena venus]|uniref:Ribosomal l34e domain-containing protein n=1 Tax=Mycena venus TaxID=2733690 RepID=A0A8H6XXB9_9AGAR|nr:Ribosomal l34e domain-containing protein [Mycena venus]
MLAHALSTPATSMSHLLALADKWSRPLVGSSFITTSKRSPPLPNAVTGIPALRPYQYATISKRQKTARRAYRGSWRSECVKQRVPHRMEHCASGASSTHDWWLTTVVYTHHL